MGELTQYLPFEVVDDVLKQTRKITTGELRGRQQTREIVHDKWVKLHEQDKAPAAQTATCIALKRLGGQLRA